MLHSFTNLNQQAKLSSQDIPKQNRVVAVSAQVTATISHKITHLCLFRPYSHRYIKDLQRLAALYRLSHLINCRDMETMIPVFFRIKEQSDIPVPAASFDQIQEAFNPIPRNKNGLTFHERQALYNCAKASYDHLLGPQNSSGKLFAAFWADCVKQDLDEEKVVYLINFCSGICHNQTIFKDRSYFECEAENLNRQALEYLRRMLRKIEAQIQCRAASESLGKLHEKFKNSLIADCAQAIITLISNKKSSFSLYKYNEIYTNHTAATSLSTVINPKLDISLHPALSIACSIFDTSLKTPISPSKEPILLNKDTKGIHPVFSHLKTGSLLKIRNQLLNEINEILNHIPCLVYLYQEIYLLKKMADSIGSQGLYLEFPQAIDLLSEHFEALLEKINPPLNTVIQVCIEFATITDSSAISSIQGWVPNCSKSSGIFEQVQKNLAECNLIIKQLVRQKAQMTPTHVLQERNETLENLRYIQDLLSSQLNISSKQPINPSTHLASTKKTADTNSAPIPPKARSFIFLFFRWIKHWFLKILGKNTIPYQAAKISTVCLNNTKSTMPSITEKEETQDTIDSVLPPTPSTQTAKECCVPTVPLAENTQVMFKLPPPRTYLTKENGETYLLLDPESKDVTLPGPVS